MMLVGLTVPIQVGFCVWLLYRQLGVAAFGGLAFLVILMPAQVYLGQIMHSTGNSLYLGIGRTQFGYSKKIVSK